jgi:hypothetical protein
MTPNRCKFGMIRGVHLKSGQFKFRVVVPPTLGGTFSYNALLGMQHDLKDADRWVTSRLLDIAANEET